MKICLKFLIGSLSLAISLGVIGHGQSHVILEEASEFLSEDGGKLRTTIRDDCVM